MSEKDPRRPPGDGSRPADGPVRFIGPYEVRSLLGTGGMGEVYLARDPKLGRDVAIKMLRGPSATSDSAREQFQKEARLLAALSHPNIAAIYGLEESPGATSGMALVLELVPGDTLAARIKKGPMTPGEVLAIARQVADALEAAHASGIVHCDLKPANIKLRGDGTVKVLDFGLARFVRPPGSPRAGEETTTIASGDGEIVGTPFYMSPEQARGQAVDRRTDIWSFGCILFEMLTGERPFRGDTVTDVLSEVLRGEPDFTRIPPAFQPLIARCLARDHRQRLRDIGDALSLVEATSVGSASPAARPLRSWSRPAWLGLGAGLTALIALSLGALRSRDVASPPLLLDLDVPADARGPYVISPDGRSLIMRLQDAEGARLVVRSMATGELRELPGTTGATRASWDADGARILFTVDGALKKIAASGGAPETVLGAGVNGSSCFGEGEIVFMDAKGGISRVAETGGDPTVLTRADKTRGELHHESPFCLPGRRFLYFRHLQERGASGIYAGRTDLAPEKQSLTPVLVADDGPLVVPAAGRSPEVLLFMRADALYAQAVSSSRLELSGPPEKLAEKVASSVGSVDFGVGGGALLYRTADDPRRQLSFFDRQGHAVGTLGDPTFLRGLRIAPDGSRVAVGQFPPDRRINNDDIWIVPTKGGPFERVTSDLSTEISPLWSPDGKQIAYVSNRSGAFAVHVTDLGSLTSRAVSAGVAGASALSDWSPDGRFVLLSQPAPGHRRDVYAVRVGKDGSNTASAPIALLASEADESGAVFSPDGRYIAYLSDESGSSEVYMQAFQVGPDGAPSVPATSRRKLSNRARGNIRWRHDGREVLYLGAEGVMMSVALPSGPGSPEPPRALFPLPQEAARLGGVFTDITPDASRFLVGVPLSSPGAGGLKVLLNWR